VIVIVIHMIAYTAMIHKKKGREIQRIPGNEGGLRVSQHLVLGTLYGVLRVFDTALNADKAYAYDICFCDITVSNRGKVCMMYVQILLCHITFNHACY
jgi:hypothetical protein